MEDVVVIGAGPAGVVAALRAADLGAKTSLIARDEFGAMAANDGPFPSARWHMLLDSCEKLGSSVNTESP